MFYTYIIQSHKNGKWYYGSTSELDQRLDGHNKGINKSTARNRPWFYIFQRPFNTMAEAKKFELYLKSSRNKNYIRRAFSEYFLPSGVYPDSSGPVSAPR
jgi:putative endonuclease